MQAPLDPSSPIGPKPFGLILAGGRATRMGGGDKPMASVGGRPIAARIVAALGPQCEGLAVSAGGSPSRWLPYSTLVLPDTVPDTPGPLAGVLAALRYLEQIGGADSLLLSVPGDAPFLPHDLVKRLLAARAAAGTATAHAASGGRAHPSTALWRVSMRPKLEAALEQGRRSVGAFHAAVGCAVASWPAEPFDPFFNVNTPDDLAEADRLARIFGS